MRNNIKKIAGASFLLGCVFMVSCKSSSQTGCYYSSNIQVEEAKTLECPTQLEKTEKTKTVYTKISDTAE